MHKFAVLIVIAFASTAPAAEPDAGARRKIVEKAAASLVRIEYRVKYDKGDQPSALNFATKCSSCGDLHAEVDLSDYVKEERPVVTAGFLIGDGTVVGKDLLIHPRFIESIAVAHADDRVAARIDGVAVDRPAVRLVLERPLKKAAAVESAKQPATPRYAVGYAQKDGRWHARLSEFTPSFSIRDDGTWTCPLTADQLIVDAQGNAITATFADGAPEDGWSIAPSAWTFVADSELNQRLASFSAATESGLVRVALSFRSPRKTESLFSFTANEEDAATEQNAIGVIVAARRLLVLSNLKPRSTARLKRILVHLPDGTTAKAGFEASLRDYGAFTATTESDLSPAVSLLSGSIEELANRLLMFAMIEMKGENRVAYHQHGRISSFSRRWGDRLFPSINASEGAWFIFTQDGALACFSIDRRQKVSVEEQYSTDESVLMPANALAGVLADPARHGDPQNVPLTEEEENRIAWLGVEMQAMDSELARANRVSDRTRDGAIGGMVSHVYPGSPAEEAGIQPGDILLALHVPGEPKPLDITTEDDGYGGNFPWERWDELPEQYFDSVSRPWPSADSTLAQSLTRLGFGRPFELELFRDGDVKRLPMTVTQSPPHYDSAAKHKNKALGITVRNLTYEVNRYFQRSADEPGLIISRIEPGSKASVAGLKPFEIITHVNDEPVHTAKQFKQLVKGQESLRLAIKRMTRGRIVRITLDKKDGPAVNAASTPAYDGPDTPEMTLARAAVSENGMLAMVMELYKFQCDTYPAAMNHLVEKPDDPDLADKWKGPYINDAKGLLDPWGNEYLLRAPGEKNTNGFDLWSAGPNGISGDGDDITNW